MRVLDYSQLSLLNDVPADKKKPAAVTVGVFDGIHKGHMKLLNEVTSNPKLDSYVITFHENPKKILRPDDFHGCILTKRQKMEHLDAHGIDTVVLIDFSSDFSKLRGEEFFDYVSGHIPLVKLIIGSNFRCGIGASFTAGMIRNYYRNSPVEVSIIDQLVHDDKNRISSSYVRLLIKKGNMKKAAELLDKVYSLDLTVCGLKVNGSSIFINPEDIIQLLPPPGLYRVVMVDGSYADSDPDRGTLLISESLLTVQLEKPLYNIAAAKRELMIIEKID
jgi:riboflavin kinase / FMN adenylyltransferase